MSQQHSRRNLTPNPCVDLAVIPPHKVLPNGRVDPRPGLARVALAAFLDGDILGDKTFAVCFVGGQGDLKYEFERIQKQMLTTTPPLCWWYVPARTADQMEADIRTVGKVGGDNPRWISGGIADFEKNVFMACDYIAQFAQRNPETARTTAFRELSDILFFSPRANNPNTGTSRAVGTKSTHFVHLPAKFNSPSDALHNSLLERTGGFPMNPKIDSGVNYTVGLTLQRQPKITGRDIGAVASSVNVNMELGRPLYCSSGTPLHFDLTGALTVGGYDSTCEERCEDWRSSGAYPCAAVCLGNCVGGLTAYDGDTLLHDTAPLVVSSAAGGSSHLRQASSSAPSKNIVSRALVLSPSVSKELYTRDGVNTRAEINNSSAFICHPSRTPRHQLEESSILRNNASVEEALEEVETFLKRKLQQNVDFNVMEVPVEGYTLYAIRLGCAHHFERPPHSGVVKKFWWESARGRSWYRDSLGCTIPDAEQEVWQQLYGMLCRTQDVLKIINPLPKVPSSGSDPMTYFRDITGRLTYAKELDYLRQMQHAEIVPASE